MLHTNLYSCLRAYMFACLCTSVNVYYSVLAIAAFKRQFPTDWKRWPASCTRSIESQRYEASSSCTPACVGV